MSKNLHKVGEDSSMPLPEGLRVEYGNILSGDYHDSATIGDIEIVVDSDERYNGFVICFPQIDFNTAHKLGVPDQLIRISENPADAKKAFDFAKTTAHTEKNVYKLYEKVKTYIESLERNR